MIAPTRLHADDATLIEQSWHEPEAFAGLYDRHAAHIHRYVTRRLGNQVADALGRPALGLSGAGLDGSFLLDPGSYALIGLRDGGAVITRIAVAVVDGPGQR